MLPKTSLDSIDNSFLQKAKQELKNYLDHVELSQDDSWDEEKNENLQSNLLNAHLSKLNNSWSQLEECEKLLNMIERRAAIIQ